VALSRLRDDLDAVRLARRRARAAAGSLRARVEEVRQELVIAPVEAELDVERRLCKAVASARRRGRRRR
jgi:hypothetical protein